MATETGRPQADWALAMAAVRPSLAASSWVRTIVLAAVHVQLALFTSAVGEKVAGGEGKKSTATAMMATLRKCNHRRVIVACRPFQPTLI